MKSTGNRVKEVIESLLGDIHHIGGGKTASHRFKLFPHSRQSNSLFVVIDSFPVVPDAETQSEEEPASFRILELHQPPDVFEYLSIAVNIASMFSKGTSGLIELEGATTYPPSGELNISQRCLTCASTSSGVPKGKIP